MDRLDEAKARTRMSVEMMSQINAPNKLHRAVADLTVAVACICEWLESQPTLQRNLPGGK
jgi:hypothetical protein